MPDDKLKLFYDALKANPNITGLPDDYSKFASVMSDTNKAKQFYETIKGNPNITGLPDDSDKFLTGLDLKKKDNSQYGSGISTSPLDIAKEITTPSKTFEFGTQNKQKQPEYKPIIGVDPTAQQPVKAVVENLPGDAPEKQKQPSLFVKPIPTVKQFIGDDGIKANKVIENLSNQGNYEMSNKVIEQLPSKDAYASELMGYNYSQLAKQSFTKGQFKEAQQFSDLAKQNLDDAEKLYATTKTVRPSVHKQKAEINLVNGNYLQAYEDADKMAKSYTPSYEFAGKMDSDKLVEEKYAAEHKLFAEQMKYNSLVGLNIPKEELKDQEQSVNKLQMQVDDVDRELRYKEWIPTLRSPEMTVQLASMMGFVFPATVQSISEGIDKVGSGVDLMTKGLTDGNKYGTEEEKLEMFKLGALKTLNGAASITFGVAMTATPSGAVMNLAFDIPNMLGNPEALSPLMQPVSFVGQKVFGAEKPTTELSEEKWALADLVGMTVLMGALHKVSSGEWSDPKSVEYAKNIIDKIETGKELTKVETEEMYRWVQETPPEIKQNAIDVLVQAKDKYKQTLDEKIQPIISEQPTGKIEVLKEEVKPVEEIKPEPVPEVKPVAETPVEAEVKAVGGTVEPIAEPLKDVESTTKAFNNIWAVEWIDGKPNNQQKTLLRIMGKIQPINDRVSYKMVSEAYHEAKANGTNPELVKAVEDLLGKKEPPPANDIPATTKVEPVEPVVETATEKPFERFENIVTESKSLDEAFNKAKEIRDLNSDIGDAFREKYDPENNLTPKQAFEKFYNEVKGEKPTGKEIEKHPEVKANQQIAIKEVLSLPRTGFYMKEMEAGFLYGMRNGDPVIEETSGLKSTMQAKLYKEDLIDYNDNGDYVLTEKGQRFIDKVNARIETRKGVKAGTDLFPEDANIPEFKPVLKEIETHIKDGNTNTETVNKFKSRTADEVEKSEPVVKALEDKEVLARETKSIDKLESEVDAEIKKVEPKEQPEVKPTTETKTPEKVNFTHFGEKMTGDIIETKPDGRVDIKGDDGIVYTNTPKENITQATLSKSATERGKEISDWLKTKKSTKGKVYDATIGVPIAIWDGMIEAAAKTAEVSGKLIDTIGTAIDKMKDSDWYKNLSISDKKKYTQRVLDYFSSPDVDYLKDQLRAEGGIDAVNKVIKTNELSQLKKKISDLFKGESIGIKEEKTKQVEFSEKIKELLDDKEISGKLTPSQAKSLINRSRNVKTDRQFESFQKYAEKVIDDVNYSETYSKTKSNNRRISKQLNGSKFGNERDFVREFLDIDISDFTTEQLNKHIQIQNGLLKSKVPDIKGLSDYVKDNYKPKIENKDVSTAKNYSDIDKAFTILSEIRELDTIDKLRLANNKIVEIRKKASELYESGKITKDEFDTLLGKIDNVNLDNFTVKGLEQEINNQKTIISKSLKDRIKGIDKTGFTPETAEIIDSISKIKTETLSKMSLSQLDTIDKVVDGLENGFYNKEMFDILSRADRIETGDMLTTFINEQRGNKTLLGKLKDVKKATVKAMTSPIHIVDDYFGMGRNRPIYKTFKKLYPALKKASEASSNEMAKVSIAARKINKFKREKVLTNIGMILSEMNYRSNKIKINGEVKIWDELTVDQKNKYGYLFNDVKSFSNAFPLGNKRIKLYKEVYESLPKDADGIIDIDAAINNLSKNEKLIFDEARLVFSNLQNKARINSEKRGMYFAPLKDYFRSYVKQKSEFGEIDTMDGIDKPIETILSEIRQNKPSVKAGSTYERDYTPRFEELNVMDVLTKATSEVYTDYYVADAIKSVWGGLSDAKRSYDGLERNLFDVMEATFEDRLKQQLRLNNKDYDFFNKLVQNSAKYVRYKYLVRPTKVVLETATNYINASIRQGLLTPNDFTRAADGRYSDLFNDYDSLIQEKFNSFKSEMIKTGKSKAEQAAVYMMTLPDNIIGKPLFVKSFNKSFKKSTGGTFDINKYSEDVAYRELFDKEIEQSIVDAEIISQEAFNSLSQFGAPSKSKILPGKKFVVNKDDWKAQTFGLMTSFSMNETGQLMKNIGDVFTGKNQNRTDAGRKVAATFVANSVYNMGRVTAGLAIASILGSDDADKKLKQWDKNLYSTLGNVVGGLIVGRYSNVVKPILGFAMGAIQDHAKKTGLLRDIAFTENFDILKDAAKMGFYTRPISLEYTKTDDVMSAIPLLGDIAVEINSHRRNITSIIKQVSDDGVESLVDVDDKAMWDLLSLANSVLLISMPNPVSPALNQIIYPKQQQTAKENKELHDAKTKGFDANKTQEEIAKENTDNKRKQLKNYNTGGIDIEKADDAVLDKLIKLKDIEDLLRTNRLIEEDLRKQGKDVSTGKYDKYSKLKSESWFEQKILVNEDYNTLLEDLRQDGYKIKK